MVDDDDLPDKTTIGYFSPRGDPHLFRCACGMTTCDAPQPSADLLSRLNMLRYRLDRPLIVTSGPRCAAYNKQVGGAPNSDHLTGDGADLSAKTSKERWEIMAANFAKVPIFTRLGVGRDFIHVGMPMRNPPCLIWTYYPR